MRRAQENRARLKLCAAAQTSEVLARAFIRIKNTELVLDVPVSKQEILKDPSLSQSDAMNAIGETSIRLITDAHNGRDVTGAREALTRAIKAYLPHRESAKAAVRIGLDGYTFHFNIGEHEKGTAYEARGGLGCRKSSLLADKNYGRTIETPAAKTRASHTNTSYSANEVPSHTRVCASGKVVQVRAFQRKGWEE